MRRKIVIIVITTLFIVGGLFHVQNTSSENEEHNWIIQTVEIGSIGGTSLVLDSNGNPHISYGGEYNSGLKYAKRIANTWSTKSVGGSVGDFTSLALDSEGKAHIVYSSSNRFLYYVKWTGSEWINSGVDFSSLDVKHASIAIDRSDKIHMSYFGDSALKYAIRIGNQWQFEIVDDNGIEVGKYSSIALDDNDYPHISYYANSRDSDLRYANWNGSVWNITVVDSIGWVGKYTSLKIGSDNYPHISYYDEINRDLKYAMWNGSEWNIETVDSLGDVGITTSLALDNNDYAHISYRGNDHLKLARWNGSAWHIETVDEDETGGSYSSIAVDEHGYVHISYSRYRSLGYAQETNATVPLAPQNLVAIAGDSEVTLTWNEPISNGGLPITNYKIYMGTSSGDEKFISIIGNETTYTDVYLTNGWDYYYRVSAVNEVGEGALSNEVKATPRSIILELLLWLYIGVVIVTIIVAAIILYRKKKKEQQLAPPPE